MANYYAAARSNYFKVKDADEFLKAMELVPNVEIHAGENGTFCILGEDPDGGGWPAFIYNEETDDYEDFDLPDYVSQYLADDSVAIFMETGAEKLRYVVGYAVAVNNKGEQVTVSLNDIYEMAAELTNKPEEITTAEF